MTFRKEEKLLISNGWYFHHTNGSHYIFKNNKRVGSIAAPRHNVDIPKGTLNSNLKHIKKTVNISKWINSKAESLKINFSKILEEALLQKIYDK